jgi:prolyl 4-hydroxylase
MNIMQEEKFKLDSFIGGWYIDPKICDNIINYFVNSKRKTKGKIYGRNNELVVDLDYKSSTDIGLNANDSLFDDYNEQLILCIKKYMERYIETKNLYVSYSSSVEHYNIQKYLPGEGFKNWHCERSQANNRCLVFMTYLNDVKDGGTYFKYQNLLTKAKKGLTLIWPSDFTHTHKGQISKKTTKYIVTGWFNFLK